MSEKLFFRQARRARYIRPIRTPCHRRRLAPTVVSQRVSLACPHQLQPSCSKLPACSRILVAFPNRLDVTRFVASVLPSLGTATVVSGLADSFRLYQIVFEPLLVHKIILHPCGNPGSAFLRVKCEVVRSPSNTCSPTSHLLRDVNASAVLFVSGSRRCRSGLHFWFTIGMHLAGAAGSGSTSTRPSCKLHEFPSIPNIISRFQRTSLFRLRMLRHFTTAALLLTMCSPVRVLKPTQQPSIQFTASFCGGGAVLCGLNKICLPNAAICRLNGLPWMR